MRPHPARRQRLVLWGVLLLAIVVGAAGLYATHQRVLPALTCTRCHAIGITQEAVMRTSGSPFTGPDVCEPCHAQIYHRWTRSEHCRAMMRPGPTTVFSEFSPDTVRYSYRGFNTKMVSKPDGYFMVAPGEDGVARPYKIDLVVGIRDQQGFLTKFPDGRYQVLPSAYDMLNQTWFDATEGLVRSDHPLNPSDQYYWTSRFRSWNRECFNCHLSGMEKNYDPATDTYNTAWRDLGIDCEACHGPGLAHSRLRTIANRSGKMRADTSLVRLQDLPPRKQVEVCADCHARKAVLGIGYRPGKDWYEYYQLALLDDYLIMPDGRYWGLMYDVLALMQSPCYEKGGITCTHCHDPHGSGRRNDIRAKFTNDNDICRPCHDDIVDNPRPHTFHKADGVGSNCRSCHMQALPMTRMRIADHTLSIPTPENTIAYNTPNACSECHPDSSLQWAVNTLNRWYGPHRRDRWTRARVLFQAKAMDTAAVRPMIAMLGDTSVNMIWRANAAYMLGGLRDPRAIPALMRLARAPDPLLRTNVIYSLAVFDDERIPPLFERLLHTETNSLNRIRIAGRLGYWWRDDVPAEDRQIAEETWQQYVRQVNTALTDWPNARADLGTACLNRGEYTAAVREYKIALRLDPKYAAAEDGLSAAYANLQQPDQALVHGRRAAELEPQNAVYHVNLGACYMALNRTDDAEAELRRAIAIEPTMAAARLNLAYVLQSRNRLPEALRQVEEALRRDGANPRGQYLLGITAVQLGMREKAIQAFVNTLSLAPDASFAADAEQRLFRLHSVGTPLPRPNVTPAPREPSMPTRVNLDPKRVWPVRTWQDHTPRTTPEEVMALGQPQTLGAAIDSAQKWVDRSDYRVLAGPTRKAYAERAYGALAPYRRGLPAGPAQRAEVLRISGHAAAVLSSYAPAEKKAAMLAQARRSLDAVDTVSIRGVARALVKLGQSYYRLGRAYNEAMDYRDAVTVFGKAGRLVPDSFTQAMADFFIGTSEDRLGHRKEALAAYASSEANPHNSARGLRCSRHAQVYPFRYIPQPTAAPAPARPSAGPAR